MIFDVFLSKIICNNEKKKGYINPCQDLLDDKFNEMTEKGYNMNKLKAYLHNSATLWFPLFSSTTQIFFIKKHKYS